MYLLVADDLTGGNDAGIQFVKHGLEAWLALSSECAAADSSLGRGGDVPRPDMFVVNTNTRNMPKEAAVENVAGVVSALASASPEPMPALVFKKIDSTLRGNLGAEIDTLMRDLAFDAAFLAPSFPAQGRVVRNGILYVDGLPVHETGFASDPLTPIRESRVSDIVARQSGRKIGEVARAVVAEGAGAVAGTVSAMLRDGVEMFVFDAESDADLSVIAEAGLAMKKIPLFIGSAGLAGALAQALPRRTASERTAEKKIERVLYVCGSAHQATRAQVEKLGVAGVPVVPFTGAFPGQDARKGRQALVDALAAALREGDAALVSPAASGAPLSESGMGGTALSDVLGELALDAVKASGLDAASLALVMTGGETAYAVLKEICTGLALEKELFPGIALCRVKGGVWDSLRVITKAGGFGRPETLVDVLRMLRPGAYE